MMSLNTLSAFVTMLPPCFFLCRSNLSCEESKACEFKHISSYSLTSLLPLGLLLSVLIAKLFVLQLNQPLLHQIK